MASATASKINAKARDSALTTLTQKYRLRFMVYVVAHTQAGATSPRNQAKADLAALFPDEYQQAYALAKVRVAGDALAASLASALSRAGAQVNATVKVQP